MGHVLGACAPEVTCPFRNLMHVLKPPFECDLSTQPSLLC